MRNKHHLYEKWVLTKHPEAAKIPLQRYNGGLMTEGKLLQTIRKIKRIGVGTLFGWLLYKAKIKKSLGRKIVNTSMNPMDLWIFGENSAIRENLDAKFSGGLSLLKQKSLINDQFAEHLEMLYNTGIATEKTQAITVIEAFEQLF